MYTGSTMTKTVWQYSEPLPEDTMEFLRGIASDYCKVKIMSTKDIPESEIWTD